jgi:branched-chain amino acid aminotransferase
VEELEEAMLELLTHCGEDEVGLRIVCTGGLSKDSLSSREGGNLFILVEPIKIPPAEWYRTGVKIISYSHKRYRPESKSLNYIPAIEAMHEAEKHGAVEALYCDDRGQISEGTTSNIFIRKNGFWLTPGRDILKGVTRQVVLNLINEDELRTQDLYLDDLDQAEEVFITSSSREILPVNQVDERSFGDCPGPETRKMMKAFREYVNSPEKWAYTRETQHGSV